MVRIIYSCYGGAHSSPVAAALHLGLLPRHRLPSADELVQLPLYDKTTRRDHGIMTKMGTDTQGNEVYVLGRGTGGAIVLRAVATVLQLPGDNKDPFIIVDTLVTVNTWMRVGGLLSRAMGMTRWGRPLVIFGTRRAYWHIVSLVEDVEHRLAKTRLSGKMGP